MRLSTRLVLLILGCLLPILTAQIYSQLNLRNARQDQIRGLVERQAALVDADMGNIINAVGQLGTMLRQFPDVLAPGGRCDDHLTALQRGLPQYRFLAVYALDGRLLCGSATTPDDAGHGRPRWIVDMAAERDVQVGPLAAAGSPGGAFLPVGVRIPSAGAESDPVILVAALDAGWIARHLEAAQPGHRQAMAQTTLIMADHDGMVVTRLPDHQDAIGQRAVGQPLPPWLRRFVDRKTGDVATVTDPNGRAYIAAYEPAAALTGLTVIETMALPDVIADIDRATKQDMLVISGAAMVALLLAWAASRRFIRQPTETLLLAARNWREGELGTRARMSDPGAEFSALAEAFNAMAAGLQAREVERRLQASFLEAQVAERTRALSESNNRLQVEIAGREKTEAALHQAQKLQAVGQLAGGIAHDFNNMLATVLGNLELMERRVAQTGKAWTDGDSDRLMRLIGRATGAVHRGSQLTSRLLAFSRRQRIAARPTDVNALLRDLITLASSTLGRRVQVAPELAEDLWPALVDPSQVEAAILNLCLNARDAMPEGGRVLISTSNLTVDETSEGAADTKDLRAGCYVRVCISDSGTGMTGEVKARAFEPFFTTKGPAGSGLGLSQVYGMARQCRGNVMIDSQPNEGTRVTLCLPRATHTEQTGALPEAKMTKAAFVGRLSNDLVLVVDDDDAVRQVTVEMTRDLGCEVAQAVGGEQALVLIDKLSPPPTLILLDYAMPGMNGIQVARALRNRGVTAPIALVTGYAELSETDIVGAQLAGLLRKPFTILELQKLLVQLRAVGADQSAERCLEPGLTDS
ncbi:response regulator [Rhodopila sp.]|uniref:response regulator n=1 Tax=Rhodopila sp. TaxID=2480087 RepID=UPI003D0EE5B5